MHFWLLRHLLAPLWTIFALKTGKRAWARWWAGADSGRQTTDAEMEKLYRFHGRIVWLTPFG
jgi:hypothetical protein